MVLAFFVDLAFMRDLLVEIPAPKSFISPLIDVDAAYGSIF
jgi:hypothetical protein